MYKLPRIVKQYNNTVHRAIKIRPIDVQSETCVELDIESNSKNPNKKGEALTKQCFYGCP